MAIAHDDSTTQFLDTQELEHVLREITRIVGVPLDLLGIDADQMATLEVAYQLRHSVRCLVASEGNVPPANWPYNAILGALRDAPEMPLRDLAGTVVQHYAQYHSDRASTGENTSLVALDSSQIDALVRAVDELARALLDEGDDLSYELFKAHRRAHGIGESDFVDLGSLAAQLAAQSRDSRVRDAAQAVLEALRPGGPVVLAAHIDEGAPGTWGVSIYMPALGFSSYYNRLALPRDTKWGELLEAYRENAESPTIEDEESRARALREEAQAQRAQWTILVYMAADNNLSGQATIDLEQILDVGSTPQVNLLVLCDRLDGATRYVAGTSESETVQESLGEFDSGSADALLDTVSWAFRQWPADRYGLVLWGQSLLEPVSGLLNDDTSGNSVDTLKLERVLREITQIVGAPLDLLGLDMAQAAALEVAYQLRWSVRCLVVSEGDVPANNWPYNAILGALQDAPEMSTHDFAETIVQRYAEYHSARAPKGASASLVALDLSRIDALIQVVDDMAQVLLDQGDDLPNELWKAHRRAYRISRNRFVDLGSLASQLVAQVQDPRFQAVAQAVREALQPGGPVILAAHIDEKMQGAWGVSIFFPPLLPPSTYPDYTKLALPQDTKWAQLLAAYHEDQPRVWLYMADGEDARQMDLLERQDRVLWGANRHTRTGDIVLMYRTAPHSDVAYLFRAASDAREAEQTATWRWDYAVDLGEKVTLGRPLRLAEIRAHPDLADWSLARTPQGAMRRKQDIREEGYWEALRGLLVAWNPALAEPLAEWEGLEPESLLAEGAAAVKPSKVQVLKAALQDGFVQAQTELVLRLAQTGRGDLAQETTEAIGDEFARVHALTEVARALAQAGEPEQAAQAVDRALQVAEGIGDESSRSAALSEVAQAVAEIGLGQEAAPDWFLARVQTIQDETIQTEAMARIIWALVDMGEADRARALSDASGAAFLASVRDTPDLLSGDIVLGTPKTETAAPSEMAQARLALRLSVEKTLDLVLERTSALGQQILGRLVELSEDELAAVVKSMGGDMAQTYGPTEGESSPLSRELGAALQRLVATLGRTDVRAASQTILDLVGRLRQGERLGQRLAALYGIERTKADLDKLRTDSQASLEQFSAAIEGVESVQAAHRQLIELCERLYQGLGFLAFVPAAVLPQAERLRATSYLALGTYVVLAGASYAGARELGLAERPAGVRSVVEEALTEEDVSTGRGVKPLYQTSFEEGFYDYQGIGELTCPEGWTPGWVPGTRPGELQRPEYDARDVELGQPEVHSGRYAASFYTAHATHDGCLYRRFRVGAGTRVRASVWCMSVSHDEGGSKGGHGMRIGIDPTGGQDHTSTRVMYGEWWSSLMDDWEEHKWHQVTVEAVAENDEITVFLHSKCDFPVSINASYWDDFMLAVGAAPEVMKITLPIDFLASVRERTPDFVGREWVLAEIDLWLADPDAPRYFVVVGEPGSGITALSVRLSLISAGEVLPPEDTSHLRPGFLSAVHFCWVGEGMWIDPHTFVESLAAQLSARYPAYATALFERIADPEIPIKMVQVPADQHSATANQRLDLSALSAEGAFVHLVREPLQALYAAGFEEPIVILVNDLGEALQYSGTGNIIQLLAQSADLPLQVRFVLTSSPGQYLGVFGDTQTQSLDRAESMDDIRLYVRTRLDASDILRERVRDWSVTVDVVIDTLAEASEGNFAYVRHLLAGLESGSMDLQDVRRRPAVWQDRLSPSSEAALLWAEGLRRATGEDEICTKYLLIGLYQERGGPTYNLLTLFDDDTMLRSALEDLARQADGFGRAQRTYVVRAGDTLAQIAARMYGDAALYTVIAERNGITDPGLLRVGQRLIIPPRGVSLDDVRPAPAGDLEALPLSPFVEEAMQASVALADQEGSAILHSRHLLAGLLSLPQDPAGEWVADLLQVQRETLYTLIEQTPDAAPPLDEIRRASARYQEPQPEAEVRYALEVKTREQVVHVGGQVTLDVKLSPVPIDEVELNMIRVPVDELELSVFLQAPGFECRPGTVVTVPLEPSREGRAAARLDGETITFELIALRPDPDATIAVEVYTASDDFLAKRETEIQVREGDIEALETDGLRRMRAAVRSRPVPQPDILFQVQTVWSPDRSTYTLHYDVNGLDGPVYRSQPLSRDWARQMEALLGEVLAGASGGSAGDQRLRLAALGRHMYQRVFTDTLHDLWRELAKKEYHSLLILADKDAWLPWELLYDGEAFLGERFVVGRWLREYESLRTHEFPLGVVGVAYHDADVDHPRLWSALLEPWREQDIGSQPELLPGGALRGLQDVSGWRGVHVLRTAGSTGATDLPAESVATLEDEVQPAKLNLRRSRPLVSLSYLRDGAPTLTALERSAAPTFVQAGCSALVGALWSVQRTAESAFLRRFYYDLWAGNSLGTAFERGRRLARAAAPGSLDWLAYVCYGDPMARPYRLVQGDGYTVIEAVGRKMEDRLRPGERIRFRASLRRKPPAWHEGRLVEVAEELAFDDLRLHVIATGLDVEPSSPITMQRWPSGDFLGRFTLAVPSGTADGTAVVQVYFVDGQKPVQNMTFSLVIEN